MKGGTVGKLLRWLAQFARNRARPATWLSARLLLSAAAVTLSTAFQVASAQPQPMSAGETIFRLGVLPSGKPLVGRREGDILVQGKAAACAACHRQSGLGESEGQIIVPPITGKYLYQPRGRALEDVDFAYRQSVTIRRESYTHASLMRAIREGIGQTGRKLNYVMPRYELDDAAMASLISYLQDLSSGPFPGVTDDTLHFATIITPDADPVARQGMLDVLNRFFADKNEFIRGGIRPLKSNAGVMFRVTRRWQLHVWELSGPADTWEEQLKQKLAAEPVFAVISGIGGANWAPVHRFCQSEAIPCLFPNVDLPVDAESDFYDLYFSKGVLLEAKLLATHLAEAASVSKPQRVLQIYRMGDVGEAAAKSLRLEHGEQGVKVENRPLAANAPADALVRLLADAGPNDVLVLWLRPGDLRALPEHPADAQAIYLSGMMGNLEAAPLPAAWRSAAWLLYPFDLPEKRRARMNFPLGWMKLRQIPVVAERIQSDTYVACGILAETLNEVLDSFSRDYLIERIEDMLSYRLTNGYYPRLSLAQGQRFASKGGYVVRAASENGNRLVASGGWLVP